MSANQFIRISAQEMQERFAGILLNVGFDIQHAGLCAEIFTTNSVDGIYTHGVNRFSRFVQYVRDGYVKPHASPSLKHQFGGVLQYDGNLGPGMINAMQATDTVMDLARQYGIGCVSMANTNHWMRGGTYGWKAAKAGFVFIGWTNTIGIMPAWGAMDARLGNNPMVMALPFKDEAIVLDMAMSQFSYGAMEQAQQKNEALPVTGGYDEAGELTTDPSAILNTKRPLPIGFWKGAGLSLLLDILGTILSGGLSAHEITKQNMEYGLSQVFIAIDISKLSNHSLVSKSVSAIIEDYHHSVKANDSTKINYPGERVLNNRRINQALGIPVLKSVWEKILKL